MRTLRPYQRECIDSILATLQRSPRCVAVLPTGLGKTVVAAHLVKEWKGGNILFLAHTRELIEQSATKIGDEIGIRPHVEMNIHGAEVGTLWQGDMVVVGSVQSMMSDKRLHKYKPYPFDLIIVDECFPAGTLVDGRPIESIRVGDTVSSFDETTGETVQREVTHVFKRPAPLVMARIHASGRTVTATLNHPIFTSRGWVNAGDIKVGDDVCGLFESVHGSERSAATETPSRRNGVVLHPTMLHGISASNSDSQVRLVREGIFGDEQIRPAASAVRASPLLLARVRPESPREIGSDEYGQHEPQVCVGSDEVQESDAQRRHQGGDGPHHADSGPLSEGSRWERPRHDGSRTDAFQRDRAISVHCSDRWTESRIPDALQTRLGESEGQVGNRNRRREPLHIEDQGGGCEEGRFLGTARVDRVEILELGSDEQSRSVCPDGYVYNLEVDGEHTYLANGFAVHNCHHATASSYVKVIDYFQELNPNLKVVGITATPNRTDETALGLVFNDVAYTRDIAWAVNEGWLVPFEQLTVTVQSLDLDSVKVKTRNGVRDFNREELEERLMEERVLHEMATPILNETQGRQAIIFTAGVQHAHELAAILNAHKPNTAAAVDGTTDAIERRNIVQRFSAGELQYVLNFGVFTEGFDAPATAAVVMGRPTKSVSLYTQMLGRGLRPLPGTVDGVPDSFDRQAAIATSPKHNCLILDFVGASRNGVVDCYDVLGGNYDVEVRQLASDAARNNGRTKVTADDLELAKNILALRRALMQREQILIQSTYRMDAVESGRMAGMGLSASAKRGGATDSQVALLQKLGVARDKALSYTKKQAGAVIDSIGKTKCTSGQAWLLQKAGINPAGIGMGQASKLIDELKAKGAI